jgi:hypothetical protein
MVIPAQIIAHTIRYLRYHYYNRRDTSFGGLYVFEGIIIPVVSVSTFGTGNAHPSGSPNFTPGFSGIRITRSLVLCVCFVDRCLSFWPLCCQIIAHTIRYLRYHYYNRRDTSFGGLYVFEGIIIPVVSVSTLTWLSIYNCNELHNNTMVFYSR